MGHSGGGPEDIGGSSGSSMSSSSSGFPIVASHLRVSRPHFQLQGFFGALAAGHADERQLAVYNGGRHGADGVAVGQLLPVRRRDIHFPVAEAVFDPQLFPETLGRGAGAATGGI